MNKDFSNFKKLLNEGQFADIINETKALCPNQKVSQDFNFEVIFMLRLLQKYHEWLLSSNN